MKNCFYAIALLFLCSILPLSGWGQNVTVDVKIDSLQRLVGEQAKITLEVSCGAKQKVLLPNFADTLVAGVEILDVTNVDTQYLNNKERMLITQKYTITSFDSASYYIPPFEVLVDSVPYHSKSLVLMVYPMDVDESNPDVFFGPQDIMQIPFSWEDWKPIIWKVLLLVCLIGVFIYLIARYSNDTPIIYIKKTTPKILPHEIAMNKIARIKEEKNWQKGKLKEYYTELTDVIRDYIYNRYGFNAMEKTSAEIIEYLQQDGNNVSIEELKQLFITADLVKFAKFAPLLNENDMNLVTAIDFVNQTKTEEDLTEKQPQEEVSIDEKGSRLQKRIFGLGIAVVVVFIILVLSFIIEHVCDLFF